MLIKWIKCVVPADNKHLFSEAQQAWRQLKGTDGFIAQVGGWDQEVPLQAGILSLWQNEDCYARFMRDVHDPIVDTSGQLGTYNSITVGLFQTPDADTGNLPAAIADAYCMFVSEWIDDKDSKRFAVQIMELPVSTGWQADKLPHLLSLNAKGQTPQQKAHSHRLCAERCFILERNWMVLND